MEENDLIVLIVDDKNDAEDYNLEVKQEIVDEDDSVNNIEELMEAAQKHGTLISIDDFGFSGDLDGFTDDINKSLDGELKLGFNIEIKQENIKDEPIVEEEYTELADEPIAEEEYTELANEPIAEEEFIEFVEDSLNDDSYSEINYVQQEQQSKVKIHHMKRLKENYQSFVKKLQQENPEYAEDTEKLVHIIAEIMKDIKPPQLPRDFYRVFNLQYECIKCSGLTNTLGAAERHYHEKHGPRYLICFACGDDFRSTTNLYKHEKRCIAPDAKLVLKARAVMLGRKGRKRPYLPKLPKCKRKKSGDGTRPGQQGVGTEGKKIDRTFQCTECPATFKCKTGLVAHERMHRGERPFSCHTCGAAYTSRSGLSRHLVSHMEAKFICDICKRAFQTKASLTYHMDTHLPERKYPCTFEGCKRRFAQKFAVEVHMNCYHRNMPLPCACKICPRRYPRMSKLKEHMMKEHGMTLITRNMFFKQLPRLTPTQLEKAKVVLTEEIKASSYKVIPDEVNTQRPQKAVVNKSLVDDIVKQLLENTPDESHIYGTVIKEEIIEENS